MFCFSPSRPLIIYLFIHFVQFEYYTVNKMAYEIDDITNLLSLSVFLAFFNVSFVMFSSRIKKFFMSALFMIYVCYLLSNAFLEVFCFRQT